MTDDSLRARADTVALPTSCACIVLAGGRSRRMGRAKASLPLGGVSLLEHVIARVTPLVREIGVVAAAAQEVVAAGVRVVRDPVPQEGPLPALGLGLATITTPWAFALACDAPFVRRALLRALAAEVGGARAAVPRWDGCLQPLVALYHRALAAPVAALAAAGERRLHAVARLPDVRVVPQARLAQHDPDGVSFRTLNTPADYADALRRWDAARGDD
jgi:molybdopterin-guanine dinucleotide biosynthesis protein A